MFYSEYGQDRWLEENVFKGRRNGTFIEAGALDGLLHSNTLFFEREREWNGLLIEPNPRAFRSLETNRPYCRVMNRALWSKSEDQIFLAIDGGLYGWSGIDQAIEPQHRERISNAIPQNAQRRIVVETMTLSQAVKAVHASTINYLSLDIEGAELGVLKAYDWSKPIEVIGVEDNFGNPELAECLRSTGYEHLARVGVDEIWRKP